MFCTFGLLDKVRENYFQIFEYGENEDMEFNTYLRGGFFNHELPKSEAIETAPKNKEQRRGNGKIEQVCAGKA